MGISSVRYFFCRFSNLGIEVADSKEVFPASAIYVSCFNLAIGLGAILGAWGVAQFPISQLYLYAGLIIAGSIHIADSFKQPSKWGFKWLWFNSLWQSHYGYSETGLADKVTGRLSLSCDADLPNLITDYAFGAVVGREGFRFKNKRNANRRLASFFR